MKLEILPKARILIVDDEDLVRNLLADVLSDEYECVPAASAEDALEIIKSEDVDLVISDIRMRGMSGIDLIPLILEAAPDTVVMTISGEQNIDCAIQAMQAGTFDYIKKPFDIDSVRMSVERALKHHFLLVEKRRYETQLEFLVEERTKQLNYLAFYDSLTELPNRVLFDDRLTRTLKLADQGGASPAVVCLAVDRFKKAQETLGYNAGIRILQEVADRLQTKTPAGSTVARFENDEFAILIPHVKSTDEVVGIVETVKNSIKLALRIDDVEVFISASAGISMYPGDGTTAETLERNAASALARAREKGDDRYEFFAEEMNLKALKKLDMEAKFRHALERDEFEIYYQPKKNFSTDQVVGMEALVRWNHPELGVISPSEFIPLAEETGLIIPLSETVLRTACRQTKELIDQNHDLRVAVNLSAKQFQHERLAEQIIEIVAETGINPLNLELEVTESALLEKPDAAIEILQRIRDFGIRISIDDFGTGYSSLGYLKRLPIDTLKIDRTFVQDITHDAKDASLVMAIISLAHNLGLKVTAEGVETTDQLSLLRLLRCDEWQGFFFSRPVPFAEFVSLVSGNAAVKTREA